MIKRFATLSQTQQTSKRAGVVLGLLLLVAGAGWAAHITQAEFEVPLVDTTDFIPTDFRSVWTYSRQAIDAGNTYRNYEGYAVGQPTQPEQGTTAIYRFNG